ncbi:MAG: polyphenol oxidase family protein [bacterium]|nr:polyphenol oxidase family protein [bacterium]
MQKVFLLDHTQFLFSMEGNECGGFNKKYTEEKVAKINMQKLKKSFNNSRYTIMKTQCSSKVAVIDQHNIEKTCDSIISATPGHSIIFRPADCIPLFIYTNSPNLFALIHCSRAGLEGDIIKKTIRKMKKLGMNPKTSYAYLGPSIKQKSYELPKDIIKNLKHSSWKNLITKSSTSILLSLDKFAVLELKKYGFSNSNITVSSINTATNTHYYSHYRATRFGVTNGRNGVAVAMKLIPR